MSKHRLVLADEIQLRKTANDKDIRPGELPSAWIKRLQEAANE